MGDQHQPADVVVFGTPGDHEFRKADYPADRLDPITHITVGRGGRGGGGFGEHPRGEDGDDAMIFVEVYTCGCQLQSDGEPAKGANS